MNPMQTDIAQTLIEVVVGLFTIYVVIYAVAYVWVYGYIPDLISSIVHWLK